MASDSTCHDELPSALPAGPGPGANAPAAAASCSSKLLPISGARAQRNMSELQRVRAATSGAVSPPREWPTTTAGGPAPGMASSTAAADLEGLDIAHRLVDGPLGPLLLAATAVGLVRVAHAGEDHELVLARLAGLISPRVVLAPSRLEAPARQLEQYLAGRRRRFDLALDLRLATGFRRRVLERLPQIDYGATATYTAVAAAAGNPGAARAAGSACAANPLPIVLPCHRVVRGDGSLGGYSGGAEAKRALLELEAATAATTP